MGRIAAFLITVCFLKAFPAMADSVPSHSQLQRLAVVDLRVASIGYRLLTANSARCTMLMPANGLLLHSLPQYRAELRDEAVSIWTFPAAVSIEAVVPQGPAARAGIRSGDGLLEIEGQALPQSLLPGQPTTGLRDHAEELLQARPPAGPIALTIRRGDHNLTVMLASVPACRSKIEVAPGLKGAARSDGRTIQLGQAFAESIDDDGLAVAIAHELAHTILSHRKQLASLGAQGRSTRALARRFEDEADLLSLALLSDAGWDPAIAPRFMRAQGKRYDPVLPGSGKHRSAEDRARRMELYIRSGRTAFVEWLGSGAPLG
ncbi:MULTISPECIES: PDZ domain-containing protein [unclassified Novosphingobium]|uniref:PDZ domain-containing protein n=1 Tax=unclassified Novosphingobium TaxID=2644732 RepID=UPI0025D80EFC|nr:MULTISPECIES: PDZ domain-containing protein [unclassified Novosphingobium]HQV02563.1 PDZ domain-containing protein [Novosphingobium sp.]